MMLSVVVPIYNEEDALKSYIEKSVPILNQLTSQYEIIFAMDPGQDHSETVLIELMQKNPSIKALKLSRKFGQTSSVLAGLTRARGEAVIIMDVDLQDPPEAISEMVDKWKKGAEVVYAKRCSRQGEPWSKRLIAFLGYRLIRRLAEIPIPPDVGDFRLMSRKAVSALLALSENHGFIRGAVALVGFKQDFVLINRPPRTFGKSRYSKYFGSIKIGMDGIFGFSNQPLKLNYLSSLLFLLIGSFFIFRSDFEPTHREVLIALFFTASWIQLNMGITSSYTARIYHEVKKRPPFIIDQEWGFD
jgi:dolichol-phosphate mannosyltransferase